MEPFKMMIHSEIARTELAACVLTLQRRTAMTRPRRGRLDYCNTTTEVRRVLRRVKQGWWCTELPWGALVAR